MFEMFDFSATTIWWVVAGLLVVTELLTGSFYLLMISSGAVAGALLAMSGATFAWQMSVAAAVSIVAALAWHFNPRNRAKSAADTQNNPDVHSDIGQKLRIAEGWFEQTGARDRVSYRGTIWRAQIEDGQALTPGEYQIQSISGSTLVIKQV